MFHAATPTLSWSTGPLGWRGSQDQLDHFLCFQVLQVSDAFVRITQEGFAGSAQNLEGEGTAAATNHLHLPEACFSIGACAGEPRNTRPFGLRACIYTVHNKCFFKTWILTFKHPKRRAPGSDGCHKRRVAFQPRLLPHAALGLHVGNAEALRRHRCRWMDRKTHAVIYRCFDLQLRQ